MPARLECLVSLDLSANLSHEFAYSQKQVVISIIRLLENEDAYPEVLEEDYLIVLANSVKSVSDNFSLFRCREMVTLFAPSPWG